ncbi:response regulator transcription factor [Paenibacillus thermotolerans]|uniref:response regulator transcription factor n=1 Tax=Paenibacillus thermotolerans TaxID=3027807 RepID=UPI002368ADDE|nr:MULTISPECIES: helix-turn-helix domain-containing protein [unclassified Paenibacillus]
MRVVIADDEQYIRSMFAEFHWSRYGISIEGIACDGQEAYEMALLVKPNLVLTDIRMPRMSGLELMKSLKEKMPELKFILLTGYSDFEYAREALRLGASDYLVKPCSEKEIIHAVLAVMGEEQAAAAGRQQASSEDNAAGDPKRRHAVKLACEKIREDLSAAVSLTEIAEVVQMNPSSFSRLFRQEMGVSFSEYVTTVRMNAAKKLLLDSNEKINEIARKVGYVSPSHFVQLFGEYTGMTPGRFREING